MQVPSDWRNVTSLLRLQVSFTKAKLILGEMEMASELTTSNESASASDGKFGLKVCNNSQGEGEFDSVVKFQETSCG
jgi:hypothetical protein